MANKVRVIVWLTYSVVRASTAPFRSAAFLTFIRGGTDEIAEGTTSHWRDEVGVANEHFENAELAEENQPNFEGKKIDFNINDYEEKGNEVEKDEMLVDSEISRAPYNETDEEAYHEIKESNSKNTERVQIHNRKVLDEEDSINTNEEIESGESWHESDETFETEVIHHGIDDDSSAFVDREELADAYDDDETPGVPHTNSDKLVDGEERASIDDVPRVDQSTGFQEYEKVVDQEAENSLDSFEVDSIDLNSSGKNCIKDSINEDILIDEPIIADSTDMDHIRGENSFDETVPQDLIVEEGYDTDDDKEERPAENTVTKKPVNNDVTNKIPDHEPAIAASVATDNEDRDNILTDKPLFPDFVTKETREVLIRECGFKNSEIKGLNIHIANIIADKGLRRPLGGIPSSWYDDELKDHGLRGAMCKILKITASIILGTLIYQNLVTNQNEGRYERWQ